VAGGPAEASGASSSERGDPHSRYISRARMYPQEMGLWILVTTWECQNPLLLREVVKETRWGKKRKKRERGGLFWLWAGMGFDRASTPAGLPKTAKHMPMHSTTQVPKYFSYTKVRGQSFSSGVATATPLPPYIYYLYNHNCLE